MSEVAKMKEPTTQQKREAQDQKDRLDKRIHIVGDKIQQLEGMLEDVLRKEAENECGTEESPQLCPLADQLMRMGNTVGSITDRVDSIIERLEV